MAADAVGTSRIDIVANTGRFTSGMRHATKGLGRFRLATKQASGAVKGLMIGLGGLTTMGGLSTMLGFGAVTYSSVRFAGAVEKLNQSFKSSLAIMGDVSSAMKDKMMKTTLDTARVTRYSAGEIARAYYYLASAGMSAEQSVAAMPAMARFAQAGMFDMARATDLATDAQSALGMKSEDAKENLKKLVEVTDALVKANTLANASVEQFSIALTTKAGAALRQVNKGIAEGLGVLAVFADQGVKGAEAGTALAIVMRYLQTNAIKNEEAFKQMNIRVFDSMDNMRNMADIVRDLENAMRGLSDYSKKKIMIDLGIPDKSVNFLLSLIGKSGQMRQYERDISRGGGTTADVAAKQMTTWMTMWNRISADLMKFGNEHVLPFVKALADLAPNGDISKPLGEAAQSGKDKFWGMNQSALAIEKWGTDKAIQYREFNNKWRKKMHDMNPLPLTDGKPLAPWGFKSMEEAKAYSEALGDAMTAMDPATMSLAERKVLEANVKQEKINAQLKVFYSQYDSLMDWAGDRVDSLSLPGAKPSNFIGPIDMRNSAKSRGKATLWEEEQDAARKAADKMQKALEKGAIDLEVAMRTPTEAFRASMQKLNEMRQKTDMTDETYSRAKRAALLEMMPAGGGATSSNAAIEYGTQAYFANEARRQDRAMQERWRQDQLALLEEIADGVKDEEKQ